MSSDAKHSDPLARMITAGVAREQALRTKHRKLEADMLTTITKKLPIRADNCAEIAIAADILPHLDGYSVAEALSILDSCKAIITSNTAFKADAPALTSEVAIARSVVRE